MARFSLRQFLAKRVVVSATAFEGVKKNRRLRGQRGHRQVVDVDVAFERAAIQQVECDLRANSETFADVLQFLDALLADFRIAQSEFLHGLEDDVRNDQAGVFLVVGGDGIPGRVFGAGRLQA
jgi:hypothetical protein